SSRSGPAFGLAFAEPAPGPVPRRVAALLGPAPSPRRLPPAMTRPGLAFLMATTGAGASPPSPGNAAQTHPPGPKAAPPHYPAGPAGLWRGCDVG
ncbi:hypothetical protein ACFV3O_17430, partial [Streptomyces albidoflavus]